MQNLWSKAIPIIVLVSVLNLWRMLTEITSARKMMELSSSWVKMSCFFIYILVQSSLVVTASQKLTLKIKLYCKFSKIAEFDIALHFDGVVWWHGAALIVFSCGLSRSEIEYYVLSIKYSIWQVFPDSPLTNIKRFFFKAYVGHRFGSYCSDFASPWNTCWY